MAERTLTPGAGMFGLISLFFHGPRDYQAVLSFPTRRSSDLPFAVMPHDRSAGRPPWPARARSRDETRPYCRSEEHTSELQSRGQLVCRLLLEKKYAVTVAPATGAPSVLVTVPVKVPAPLAAI